MQTLDFAVLAGYFLLMIVIGAICSLRIKKQEDFFMGGRSFGKLLQTFAAFGAGTSANDPIQTGRTVWTSGLSGIWSVLMWLFVTPFYWIFAVWYRRMRHLTLGDWFVERYQSKSMGAAYTLFAFAFCIVYLSSAFSAISKVAVPMLGFERLAAWGYANPEDVKYALVPTIAVVVILYGVLGGLRAAYWTDLIQGLCIILLSVILIPYGLSQLVEVHGGAEAAHWTDGFRIMHERVPADYFQLFSGPRSGEFPLHYIISLTMLGLIGIVVQPHFIATGGGTAKTENNARIGLVTGNFLKRFCTIGWALTGLIVLALIAGSPIAARDPDYLWGEATTRILSPLGMGLVGLMLACLLAALMSSADCYMLITSALVVRNIYAPYFDSAASERKYIAIGRGASLIVIFGAAAVSLLLYDVFEQFKLALELTIVFAAPFWIGMFWRRANRTAAWLTMAFSLTVFFIVPIAAPLVAPALRTSPIFAATTNIVETTITRPASTIDIEKHQAWVEATAAAELIEDDELRQRELKALGNEPPVAPLGEMIEVKHRTGGSAVFWTGGLKSVGEPKTVALGEPEVSTNAKGHQVRKVVSRTAGEFVGQGNFQFDYLFYQLAGWDFSTTSNPLLQTLRLPPRLITPFLVMILLSLITPRDKKEELDRYYVKMKTPVLPDEAQDAAELEDVYKKPDCQDGKRLFPAWTGLEFQRPTLADVLGFLICVGICIAFVALAGWVAGIGG